MLQFLTQSAWADRIGWVLVHSLWQFALVALVVIVLQRALQRCSAVTRYWALLAAMLIMVAVPVVTWFSPWAVDAPVAVAKLASAQQPEMPASQPMPPLHHGNDTVVRWPRPFSRLWNSRRSHRRDLRDCSLCRCVWPRHGHW